MDFDLYSLRELPFPYLGWYLEGKAVLGARLTYQCHAAEHQGEGVFRVTVVPDNVAGGQEAQLRAAKETSLALAKGKVFLGTWEHQQEYHVNLPLAREKMPTQQIRDRILGGLFRLYEDDFAEDTFQVDVQGIASELRVSRSAVERALDWLYDKGFINDHGTLGQHRGTGHFWLSSAGAAYVEERLKDPVNTVAAAPMTSEQRNGFAKDRKRVAVVYGRDSRLKGAMFTFLRALELRPIEWGQAIAATGKATPYNKEAVAELFKDAQAVVVLMTGDDEAQLREQFRLPDDGPDESRLTPQPRPNVLIELGMAFGIMEARTVIVQVGTLRSMSDLDGLNVVRLSHAASSRKNLVERLKAAECDLNDSGTDWLTAGDFTPTPSNPAKPKPKLPLPPTQEALRRDNEGRKATALFEERQAAWSEQRDRPQLGVSRRALRGLETEFEPSMAMEHLSGEQIGTFEWRFRGPRFPMEWRQARGSALARTHFVERFDLSQPPSEDDKVGLNEMGFEIRFHWRGRWRHELHRWPIARQEFSSPPRVHWDIGEEILPPLYSDDSP